MPQQLADPEEVERPPVDHELDRAAAHDAQVADGLGALAEDRRPGGVVLELSRRGDALELLGAERVERRMDAQKVRGARGGRRGQIPVAAVRLLTRQGSPRRPC
jgi:hypothetical protein